VSAPRVYVETLAVVLRASDRETDSEPQYALVGEFDIGADLAVDALSDELQRWAVDENLEPYIVETRRSIAQVGATGIGTQIALWLLAAGGTIALEEAWETIKARLPSGDQSIRRELDWLRQLEPGERPQYLAAALATALGARRAELTLLRSVEAAGEIDCVFETSTVEQYRVRATPDYYVIERLDRDARS
jgi:hypothetical protein